MNDTRLLDSLIYTPLDPLSPHGTKIQRIKTAEYASDITNEVMHDCVQLHGGMSFMSESPIESM